MRAPKRKTSQAVKDGHAAGQKLGNEAGTLLLVAYNNRHCDKQSASTRRWAGAWEGLVSTLGVMADDPGVSAALKEIDEAHGDGLVEHEDSAWHAAWSLAMNLRGGR